MQSEKEKESTGSAIAKISSLTTEGFQQKNDADELSLFIMMQSLDVCLYLGLYDAALAQISAFQDISPSSSLIDLEFQSLLQQG